MEKPIAHVAQYKKDVVNSIKDLVSEYPVVALVNMENLPAPQLHVMRAKLRGSAIIKMTKKKLIILALEQIKNEKKGIEIIEHRIVGMPALLFTKDNPFRLSRLLQKNKSPAPAKPGQTAPNDLVISKGPTNFAPGPIIGELAVLGIKAGVEAGKVAIKEDKVLVKKGEKISQNAASLISRFGIMPMEVGLDLVAVYENGVIYTKDILSIDDLEYKNRIYNASRWAFNLAMYSCYPTKNTISLLVGKAFNDAKAVGVTAKIFDEGIIDLLVSKAEMQMLSLKNAANIQVEIHPRKTEEAKEIKGETKAHVKVHSDLDVPSRKELEENIKRREQERAVKEIEKIAKEIVKKHALEQNQS